jgi:hypothetical protein
MKRILIFFKKHSSLLIIIAIILSFIIPKKLNDNNIRRLFILGQKSVAYVYDESSAKATVFSSKYYFTIDKKKYMGICATPKGCYSKGKFYILYYMPNDPRNSTLDFKQEIIPDLVYKYFPQGENPFEFEVSCIKDLREK